MRRWTIYLAFILLTSTRTFGCICGLETIQTVRKKSIDINELIFIGQVVKTDTVNGTFTLKIIKVFKGHLTNKVEASSVIDSLGRISSCGFWPSPHWGDKFIIYANLVKGTNRIFIDDCSATRSISNPNIHLSYPPYKLKDKKQLRQAKKDLKEELEILEKLKAR
jgi:hypothetical protein